jgi:hypothetical protein
MTEIVIWTNSRIPFGNTGNVLNEDPNTGLLHNFTVSEKATSISCPDFLLKFQWEILDARIKPQCHVIIIDSKEISGCLPDTLQKICACSIAFVLAHPMKFVVFYDVLNFSTTAELNNSATFHQALEAQTFGLSSFVRIHRHQGIPLETTFKKNQIKPEGAKILARSVLETVMTIWT